MVGSSSRKFDSEVGNKLRYIMMAARTDVLLRERNAYIARSSSVAGGGVVVLMIVIDGICSNNFRRSLRASITDRHAIRPSLVCCECPLMVCWDCGGGRGVRRA